MRQLAYFWATLTPFSLQWSDEACDDHTCRGILRGGNNYRPLGSRWYFPQPGGLNGEVEDGALDRATSSPNLRAGQSRARRRYFL